MCLIGIHNKIKLCSCLWNVIYVKKREGGQGLNLEVHQWKFVMCLIRRHCIQQIESDLLDNFQVVLKLSFVCHCGLICSTIFDDLFYLNQLLFCPRVLEQPVLLSVLF